MSEDSRILHSLLVAYSDGDVIARKALLDLLEEQNDPRWEEVRAEDLDWNRLAIDLSMQRARNYAIYTRKRRTRTYPYGEAAYLRFQIECARVGATAPPQISDAVRYTRLAWLQKLFPEAWHEGRNEEG